MLNVTTVALLLLALFPPTDTPAITLLANMEEHIF
jgi:hypothetical protein